MNSQAREAQLIERAMHLCRMNLDAALARRIDLNKEIEQLERKIENYARLISPPSGFRTSLENPPRREKRMQSARIRHNQSEILIAELLRTRDGVGATVKELIDSTGTSRATAYRVIRRLERDGKIREDDDARWHWLRK